MALCAATAALAAVSMVRTNHLLSLVSSPVRSVRVAWRSIVLRNSRRVMGEGDVMCVGLVLR